VRSKFLGIPLPFQTVRESRLKSSVLEKSLLRFKDIEPELRRDPELMKIIKEQSLNYDRYPPHLRWSAVYDAVGAHPRFLALELRLQNDLSSIPTGPTATRTMTPSEQKFLTNAFKKVSEDVQKHPFHIHGETAITGKKNGNITDFHHHPGPNVGIFLSLGDKFHLHTHPPFIEPATSAASAPDHIVAAQNYKFNRSHTYVTNGKDVLHIQPNSTELVKLTPDPKMEEMLGKFPVAFKVPDPQKPTYPFSNHEAPGAL
ncbi:MAG TPA: hypothetical protein VK465_03260, partial [Fibrobacteria bacterium]|nr:hypothetical protein [Fibrobacteria bacterium]